MPAVLLDAYGTLIEPDWSRLNAGRDAIADRAGIPRHAAHEAWTATHRDRMRGAYGSLESDLGAVLDEARASGGQPFSATVIADFAVLERENWSAGVRLYADVLPALRRLRDGAVRLAIVTNASAEAAGAIARLGLDRLVDDVVASCELGALKPDLLCVALGRLGMEPSEATLVDDEPAEVAEARGLGMNAILVRRAVSETVRAHDDRGPVVRDLVELADLILGAPSGPRG
jgi:HAD superfamily hydrolase (TIGR01509 family)